MTQVQITEEQFTKAMREAVAERGEDWVYPRQTANEQRNEIESEWRDPFGVCRYQKPSGEPACIVGLALHKIDPSLVPDSNACTSANAVLRALGAPEPVQFAARRAQAAQDAGRSWGRALAEYEQYLANSRVG